MFVENVTGPSTNTVPLTVRVFVAKSQAKSSLGLASVPGSPNEGVLEEITRLEAPDPTGVVTAVLLSITL